MSEARSVRYAAVDGGDEVTVYAYGPPDHGPAVEVCYGPVMTIPTPDGNVMNFLRIERDLAAIFEAIRNVNADGAPGGNRGQATEAHECGPECELD